MPPADSIAIPFSLLADGPAAPPEPLQLIVNYLPMILIVLVAWMMLYRPERERMRRHEELLAQLKKNDRVVTSSGIYGTVANVDREADRVALRVDDAGTVKINVTLSSIAKVLGDKSDKATPADATGGA
jgi:preprotein translocase subunit YajC